MAESEWGDKRLAAYQAVAADKNDTTFTMNVYKALSSSISNSDDNATAGHYKKAAALQDYKKQSMKSAADFERNLYAGSAAQKMRSFVALAELVTNSPVNFAGKAYAPDMQILNNISRVVNPFGDASARQDREKAKQAWGMFYNDVAPGAGNLYGTYAEMESRWGEDRADYSTDKDFEARRHAVQKKLQTERAEHADHQQKVRMLSDISGAYQSFVEKTGMDPNAEGTYAAFYADSGYGIQDKLAKIENTPFVNDLVAAIKDPNSYTEEAFLSEFDKGIKLAETARDRDIALRDKLALRGSEPAPTEDTERDLLAAWLKRPDVQAWAKQNGLRIGRVAELTQKQKDDIAAGKIPASIATKYGVLTDGPDDQRAIDFAYNQMGRTPERDLFRAAGITRKPGPNTIVEVELGRDPKLYQDPDSGKFYKDKTTGKYVRLDEPVANPENLEATDQPPPTKIVRGVRMPMLYNDAEGSIRLQDEETKREEYANPDIIRRINEPGVRSDATPTPLADRVRGANIGGALKKSGLGESENEMDIGDKPAQRKFFNENFPGGGRASVQARRERVNDIRRDLPIVPDASLDENFKPRKSTDAAVAEYTQRAQASNQTQPVEARTLQGTPTRPSAETYKARNAGAQAPSSGLLRPPPGPSNGTPVARDGQVTEAGGAQVEPKAATDTKTPSTTTPTAATGTTDPRRALFKRTVRKPDETEAAP